MKIVKRMVRTGEVLTTVIVHGLHNQRSYLTGLVLPGRHYFYFMPYLICLIHIISSFSDYAISIPALSRLTIPGQFYKNGPA